MVPVIIANVPDGYEPVVYAKDQPEYIPLPCVRDAHGDVITEWVLSDAERDRLVHGARVRLTMATHHQPLQPVLLTVTGLPAAPGVSGG